MLLHSKCKPVHLLIMFCVFASGKVFKGTWNRTEVAIKVLVMQDGVAPSYLVR